MKPYLLDLNCAQLQAATTTKGPVLLVAVAGSGKTKTLISRVAYLLDEEKVNPENILLVTFTNKAAKEMVHRLSQMLGHHTAQKIQAGTFHSFCIKTLQKHKPEYLQKVILDSSDAVSALQLSMANIETSAEFKALTKKKDAILNIISYSKNTLSPLIKVLARFDRSLLAHLDTFEEIAQAYESYKNKNNFLDFDDILTKMVSEMKSDPVFCQKVSQQCHYLMVDEYQDTNALQAELCKLLASRHLNIMAVGDEAQSIYSFRGANFDNIMNFSKDWIGCQTIILDHNYRSNQPILDIANNTLKHMKSKYEKRLKAFSQEKQEHKGLPLLIELQTQVDQAHHLVDEIKEHLKQGVPLKEQAAIIKYNYQGVLIEKELVKHKIPYVKYGGLRFVESAHIKDFLSLIKLVKNPLDELAFHRFLGLIPSMGPKSLSSAYEKIVSKSFFNVSALNDVLKTTPKSKPFVDKVQDLHHCADFSDLCNKALAIVKELLPLNYDTLSLESRVRDLDTLYEISKDYSDSLEFLVDFSLDNHKSDHSEDKFVLTTIHSAKGLEFSVVYAINSTEDTYSVKATDEELHRLFYVLVTRAKNELQFLAPKENFKRERTQPSSYLAGCKVRHIR